MNIRKATPIDSLVLSRLCCDVQILHAQNHPDIFKMPATNDFAISFFEEMLTDPVVNIFIAEENGSAAGYIVCRLMERLENPFKFAMRVTPLDLYLRTAKRADATAAVLDYGAALRELASTNIFPGDLLLKNFGVTRHRRVVFYDYDELCLLTDCNFRYLPTPRDDAEEWAGEAWFYAGERDVFPEEFGRFLEIPGRLRAEFMARHTDLFGVDFWDRMQSAHRAGLILDLFPYAPERRLGA